MSLRNPAVRESIVRYLERLGDVDYQERVWVRREMPKPDFYDDFDEAVNDLYAAVDDPSTGVGDVFLDSEEASAVGEVLRLLDVALDAQDRGAAFDVINQSKQWPAVVEAANHAAGLMKASNLGATEQTID